MKEQEIAGCESCAFYSPEGLKKLGVSVDNCDYVVALAGNPNTGKSTVFNALTGLRQHTGNWPGKTVTRAEGAYSYDQKRYKLVDLPGTYSLLSTSEDEEVARNFILFGRPDVTVIVADATRLERNLNLVLQVLEITDRAVLCLNLMDEAKKVIEKIMDGREIPVERKAKKGGTKIIDLKPFIKTWEIEEKELSVCYRVINSQTGRPDEFLKLAFGENIPYFIGERSYAKVKD